MMKDFREKVRLVSLLALTASVRVESMQETERAVATNETVTLLAEPSASG